jgi:hypothetical protein
VFTSNFSAEYGLTGSGIINITPRSGSNETTEVFLLLDLVLQLTESLACAKRFIRKPSKNGFARYQAGAGVGVLLQKTKPLLL